MKIMITDISRGGHRDLYIRCLSEYFDKIFSETTIYEYNEIYTNKNFLKKMNNRLVYLKNIIYNNDDFEIFHFLTGDPFYILGSKISQLNKSKKRLLFTIHHNPQNFIKMMLLRQFSKYVDLIIVHSQYQKNELAKYDINNVQVIEYPAFLSNLYFGTIRLGNKFNEKYVLSLLGGTRRDKGLDVFLKSMKYLDSDTKERIFVQIKGKEEYFKKQYISDSLNKYKINYNIRLDYITDLEFLQTILNSDAVVIPYKKRFTGSSGPMTEAMHNGIPVIAPNYHVLGSYLQYYEYGYKFRVESPKSLAKAIKRFIKDKDENRIIKKDSKFKKRFSVDNFIKQHEKIYRKFLKDGGQHK